MNEKEENYLKNVYNFLVDLVTIEFGGVKTKYAMMRMSVLIFDEFLLIRKIKVSVISASND